MNFKKLFSLLLALIIFITFSACGSSSSGFSMYSDDTIKASTHYLVGRDDCEPSGTYTVVCTGGHGSLNINDKDLYVLASDSYLGEEYSGLEYVESITVYLRQSDVLKARAFNSTKFSLEFTYVE